MFCKLQTKQLSFVVNVDAIRLQLRNTCFYQHVVVRNVKDIQFRFSIKIKLCICEYFSRERASSKILKQQIQIEKKFRTRNKIANKMSKQKIEIHEF